LRFRVLRRVNWGFRALRRGAFELWRGGQAG
jgi:hypothetical protein